MEKQTLQRFREVWQDARRKRKKGSHLLTDDRPSRDAGLWPVVAIVRLNIRSQRRVGKAYLRFCGPCCLAFLHSTRSCANDASRDVRRPSGVVPEHHPVRPTARSDRHAFQSPSSQKKSKVGSCLADPSSHVRVVRNSQSVGHNVSHSVWPEGTGEDGDVDCCSGFFNGIAHSCLSRARGAPLPRWPLCLCLPLTPS